MIEHVDPASPEVQGLILAPTRELAIQIGGEFAELLAYYTPVSGLQCSTGARPWVTQTRALDKKPQIVVATPGRADGSL